jgi:hypothetical protein|tara:strand:+ start:170 stop:754 length:585 start_codon:yes stop_codon:yes gene_type:complete
MLESLVDALSPFNAKDLLSKIGALHLMPENAGRAMSLECLAHIAAAKPCEESAPAISANRFRELVNTHLGLSSEPGKHDDPPEHVFTEEIVFHGGSYVVFPGPNADVAETLRWLLKAISLSKTPVGTRNFRDNVIRLAVTCLSISHNIARRANVARGVVADQGKDHDISVPFSKSLSELSSTVQIDQTDLVSCL